MAFGPEDPIDVRQLVEGPLYELVSDEVGEDIATFMLDDLAPILELATSGVRRTGGSAVHHLPTTKPAPPPTDGALRIAVATMASLEELKRDIGPFADVERVRDAYELFSTIESRRGPLLVVVDGHRPPVELSTLSMLIPRIPDGCRMILWGFDPARVERFLAMDRWSTIDAGQSWFELAEALRDLA